MAKTQKDWNIDNLTIQNFKSIKHLEISAARVNVFIGKPNAGKSNLLESLVFSAIEMKSGAQNYIPKDKIRYTDASSLFYDQNYDEMISVSTGISTCLLEKDGHNFLYHFLEKGGGTYDYSVNSQGQITGGHNFSRDINIRKYYFRGIPERQLASTLNHLNPDGSNLWAIIKHNSKLKEFSSSFFRDFSLEVLFDKQNNKFDIMRKNEDSYYLIDFSMTPDTFQRMLYYLAAIESNKHAIILFEEPEAQSYPPYIQMLAEKIVDDKENQYFITTHSPFIIEKMLERAGTKEDVKIFITYFEDYQTKVHELSRKEINYIIENSIDLFFNIEAFQES